MTVSMLVHRRRRVLIVNRVGHLGGVERVILTLARGLGALGYDPVLACPGGGALAASAAASGIAVADCDFDRMRITPNPLALMRYLEAWTRGAVQVEQLCRSLDIDLIYTHHPVGSLYAARAARRLGIPVVLHVHETLPAKPLYALALRRAAESCVRFICCSAAGHLLMSSVGADCRKGRTILNGVDWSLLGRPPPPASEVTGPGPHIGVFGVIEPRKGQDIFLSAAMRLAVVHPTARFWVVGPLALRDKRRYLASLHDMANALPLAGRVTFTGFREDVIRWMRAMDVVVQASVRHESLSMALLEAMILSRPIVATRVGGTEEAISHGHNGLVVPPGDAGALATAIDRALGPEGIELGARAAEEAERRFTPGIFCHQVAQVFDEVLTAGVEVTR